MSMYRRVMSLGRKRPALTSRNPSFETTEPMPISLESTEEQPEQQPHAPEEMVPVELPSTEDLDPDLDCPVNEGGATRQLRSRTERGVPIPTRGHRASDLNQRPRHGTATGGGGGGHNRTQSAVPFSQSRSRAMTATGSHAPGGRPGARSFYGNSSENGSNVGSVGGSELYSGWDPSSGLAPMPRPVADSSAAENAIVPYFPTPEDDDVDVQDLEDDIQKRARRRSSRKLVPVNSVHSMVSDEEEEESCLICMGAFSETQKRNKRMVNPCTNQCNDSPVHPRCIYEWKERKNADKKDSASCPLCRGPLSEIAYTPPDRLRSWAFKFFEARKAFVIRPVPRSEGMVRCYVKVMNAGTWMQPTITYEMWMQSPSGRSYPHGPLPVKKGDPEKGDILLMTARKRLSNFGAARLDVTLDPNCLDLDKNSPSYLGTVVSSFSGLEHTLVAPYHREGKSSHSGTKELVSVVYGQNRVGLGVGPRKMKLALPQVRRDVVGARSTRMRVDTQISKYLTAHPDEDLPDLDDGDDEEMDEEDDDETNINVNMTEPIVRIGSQANTTAVGPAATAEISTSKEKVKLNVGEARYLYSSGVHRPARRSETMVALLVKKKDNDRRKNKGVVYSENKEPKWLDLIQAYSLDFQGRVTKPSNKNFQLTMDGVQGTALQFGKVATKEETDAPVTSIYSLDFQFPWSPLQALGVALSSSDRKLACA